MKFIAVVVAMCLVGGLSACGYKGKLKSPSQIEAQEKKKAAQKEKEVAKQKAEEEKTKEAEKPAVEE